MSSTLKKIVIGEIFLGDGDTIISTVLGSCVSVCLFSSQAEVGGVIHFALPDRSFAKNSERGDLHFGKFAIRKLLDEMLAIEGVEKSDIRAKIVGGANLSSDVSHSRDLGLLNIEMARNTLKTLNIQVVGEDVGGDVGREIFFYPATGRLRVSKVEKNPLGVPSPVATESKRKIKVLVVDDSKTIQQLLTKILSSDSIEVVGTALSAEEAFPLLTKLRPDVITLDIHMPGMNGVNFLEKFLPQFPIPTIMISSISLNEGDFVMKALELGAVDYIQKPTLEELASQTEFIREKVRTAANIKIHSKAALKSSTRLNIAYKDTKGINKIVAIGASTGGTEAVKTVLMSLPANIPPILIVQHIPPLFSAAFARRLNELCPFEVKEAVNGDKVLPGRVLIAPGGFQMELNSSGGVHTVRIFEGEKVNRHRPSVDVLFDSVAKRIGKDALGVILTGMGDDGAKGLLNMKTAGAHTIGQDEASCVVYGMPKSAALLGAVREVCPLNMVGDAIIRILEKSKAA